MSNITKPLPTLRGPHVTLRPPHDGELETLAERIARDETTASRWSTDPATILHWFTDPHVGVFVAEVDESVAGVLNFEEEDDPGYRSANMDIAMFSGSVDKGLGTEALKLLAAYLIDERGHHRLIIDPAADNARAIRAYEKVGFRPIGIARQYERIDDGEYHDNLLMDMLAQELVRL